MSTTPPTPATPPPGNPYRQLLALLDGYRGSYALAALLFAVAIALGYLPLLVIASAVDLIVVESQSGPTGLIARLLQSLGLRTGEPLTLWVPAVVIVASAGFAAVFMYLKGREIARATEGLIRSLRERLYDRLQHLPLAWHDRNQTGDLVQRCTSDVETLRGFFNSQTVEIARAVLLLGVSVPLMFYADWRMALAAIALLPLIIGFSIFFFGRVKSSFKEMDDAEGVMSAVMQENLTGIRVVRAFARQDFEMRRFDAKNTAHRDFHWKLFKVMSYFWSVSDLMCLSQLLVVLTYGVHSVTTGRISVGELLFFITIVNMFLWPVREMGRTLTEMGKAVVSIGRVHEILSHPLDPDPAPAAERSRPLPARVSGEIELRNLCFSHGEKSILSDINLRIPAGQTVALLGPSGSGKTTLISLLLRFYDYTRGSIRIDGMELSELPRKYIRSQFGVVMQEPFLFSKSLTENIRLGRPAATPDEVVEVARSAAVHASIEGFAKGYDTVVGERGVTLSGGQRQRVAIARALLRDAPILVLDDALSAVDTHTESLILSAIKQRAGRHTTLLIAHRLSTLIHADQIVVLEGGKLTQIGRHDELVNQPGLYRRLWHIQTELEEDLRAELGDVATPVGTLEPQTTR
jgi:ATP-binding cassette subfamily B protein